jgi:hypothetical protein
MMFFRRSCGFKFGVEGLAGFEDGEASVARMKRGEMREFAAPIIPDFAALRPGYAGYDRKKLSVVGKDCHTEENVIGLSRAAVNFPIPLSRDYPIRS